MKDLLRLLFETIIIGAAGATMRIIFSLEDVPKERQLKIFIGSVTLSTTVGYGMSYTDLPKVWFIASVSASALLAESIIKLILKKAPIAIGKALNKKLDITENDNN
jgi:hypothetical protein